MSNALAPVPPTSASLSLCSQCGIDIPWDEGKLPVHAIPCAHVVCAACYERLKRFRGQNCRMHGCGAAFLSGDLRWPVARCVMRRGRIERMHAATFADQGDCTLYAVDYDDEKKGVEEDEDAEEGEYPFGVCPQHSIPNTAVNMLLYEMQCTACVSNTAAAAPSPATRLPTHVLPIPAAITRLRVNNPDAEALIKQLRTMQLAPVDTHGVAKKWAEREFTRVIQWRDDLVAVVSEQTCSLLAIIDRVARERAQQSTTMFLAQRAILATMDELREELGSMTDEVNRDGYLLKLLALRAEEKSLLDLIDANVINVPSTRDFHNLLVFPSLRKWMGRLRTPHESGEVAGAGEGKHQGARAGREMEDETACQFVKSTMDLLQQMLVAATSEAIDALWELVPLSERLVAQTLAARPRSSFTASESSPPAAANPPNVH